MKSWRYRGVLGMICLMVFMFLGLIPLIQAQDSGAGQGKPALYEFGSKYCIPCKQMKEVMAALKNSHGDQVEFRMVYVDEEKPLFGEYKIVAIPTQVFLDASGKEVDRHLGALSKEEVLQKLRELKFIR